MENSGEICASLKSGTVTFVAAHPNFDYDQTRDCFGHLGVFAIPDTGETFKICPDLIKAEVSITNKKKNIVRKIYRVFMSP